MRYTKLIQNEAIKVHFMVQYHDPSVFECETKKKKKKKKKIKRVIRESLLLFSRDKPFLHKQVRSSELI